MCVRAEPSPKSLRAEIAFRSRVPDTFRSSGTAFTTYKQSEPEHHGEFLGARALIFCFFKRPWASNNMDGVFNQNRSAFSCWNEIHGGSVVQIGNIYASGNVNIGRDIIATSMGSLADSLPATSQLTEEQWRDYCLSALFLTDPLDDRANLITAKGQRV